MGRIRDFIIFIQSYGEPHEETVIIPSLITIFLAHNLEIGRVGLETAAIFSSSSFIICGLWLGLTWDRMNFFKVILRTMYMGVIVSCGYALLRNTLEAESQYGAEYYIGAAASVTENFGLLFYVFWLLGTLIRQSMFLSEEEKILGAKRRKWLLYIIKCIVNRAKPLSTWDGFIAICGRAIISLIIYETARQVIYYFFGEYIKSLPGPLNWFFWS